MTNKDVIVDTTDSNGKPLKLRLHHITNKIAQMANNAYNVRVSQLVKEGSDTGERLMLRSELEGHLKKSGIWTDQDSLKVEKLSIDIRARELLLKKGGLKIEVARSIAIMMGKMRSDLLLLIAKRQQFDSATIESVAENHRFDALVVACTFNVATNEQYFKNYDDYLERGDEPAVVAVASKMAEVLYGYDPKFSQKLFENRWLKEAGYIDDNGRYVSREGKYVDEKGKLINLDGKYINDSGELIDINGNRINLFGEFLVDNPQPFVDEDGNEVYICQKKPRKIIDKSKKKVLTQKKTKKKTSKKKQKVKV